MNRIHVDFRMVRSAGQSKTRLEMRGVAWIGAFGAVLALAGCGSGTPNVLPVANQPSAVLPSGPTLGYVFSTIDGTLRAMLGVRGSAQLSASIVPAGVYVAGETSTASNAALLEDEAGSLFALNLPLSQPIHVTDGLAAGFQDCFCLVRPDRHRLRRGRLFRHAHHWPACTAAGADHRRFRR